MLQPSKLGWLGVILFLSAFVPQQVLNVEYKYKMMGSLFGILIFYADQWRQKKAGGD